MCLLCTLLRGRMERKHDVCKKVAIAATVGMTVGIVTGILLAPKAGKETWEELLKKIQELPDKANPFSDKARKVVEEAKEKITEETQKIVSGEKETLLDIDKDLYNELHPKELTAKAEVETDADKRKLK